MKTEFTPEQLADPATATSEKAIRTCVHCGFCTATCPTYVLLGDERDSPRGRIWLIKDMLEKDATPTKEVVTHIDRCLSCLACVSTCPSGVDYAHLIDHARDHVERRYRRPFGERALRAMLAWAIPHRGRFAMALRLGRVASPFAGMMGKQFGALLRLAQRNPPHAPKLEAASAVGARKGRVILQAGCVEPVVKPVYQAAAMRVLSRAGYDVLRAPEDRCCGSLTHHMGREPAAFAQARQTIDAWWPLVKAGDVIAIVATVSGCGATLKDYGFMLRNDSAYAVKAKRISDLVKDISEVIRPEDLTLSSLPKLRIAYHAACSLQHGQKIGAAPVRLLKGLGIEVLVPAEAHLCCGSAGTYNMLQPELAGKLGARKAERLEALKPDVIVTGNIGCAVQIDAHSRVPVIHLAELLDWASGGPAPAALAGRGTEQ